MSLVYLYTLQIFLIKINVLVLLNSTILTLIITYFNKIFFAQNLLKYVSCMKFLKIFLLVSLSVSFFTYITYMYVYVLYISGLNHKAIDNNYLVTPLYHMYFFYVSADIFGLVILFLAYLVGILSLLALDTRLHARTAKYVYFINVFILIVFCYVFTNNLLLMFIFYELLFIPSFVLVYYTAPNRRAVIASLYFAIWTQIGSFLVFCSVAYILIVVGCCDFFTIKLYTFSSTESYLLYLLIFFGFGFKVPVWPFHYWLTKTHVEAPTGFSMYLSGFLVKTALYGFYKITSLLGSDLNSMLLSSLILIGVLDSSMKMWGQTDIKKLVAYGTIQEMNIIYLALCWGDNYSVVGGIIFCITHGCLSSLMFYLVDCVQRRYNSRSVTEVSGVLQTTPSLAVSIIIMCILYSGLPGTLKFTSEFYIFSGFFESSPLVCFFILFTANVLGLIGFCKCWFNIVFGMNTKGSKIIPRDLTSKEFYIIYVCVFFLVFSCFFINVLI